MTFILLLLDILLSGSTLRFYLAIDDIDAFSKLARLAGSLTFVYFCRYVKHVKQEEQTILEILRKS